METNTFAPIPTCEVPMPILERPTGGENCAGSIPRILLQAAGSGQAARNVTWLAVLFLTVALLEGGLLLRLPAPDPLIVYGEFPRTTLLEPLR